MNRVKLICANKYWCAHIYILMCTHLFWHFFPLIDTPKPHHPKVLVGLVFPPSCSRPSPTCPRQRPSIWALVSTRCTQRLADQRTLTSRSSGRRLRARRGMAWRKGMCCRWGSVGGSGLWMERFAWALVSCGERFTSCVGSGPFSAMRCACVPGTVLV